jgi:hypothetical protein
VFENRVLRRIFGPKRDEVTGEWRNFVRFQVLTAASIMFRAVFWVILPCKMIDNHFTRQYNPEYSSEHQNGGSYTMRNFIICTHPQISLGKSSQGE